MSYTPTSWETGDVITAEKLNNMENGIAAALPVMYITFDGEGVCNKTWQELYDATAAGTLVCYVWGSENNAGIEPITSVVYDDQSDPGPYCLFNANGAWLVAGCSTATDYPVLAQ